MKKYIIENIVKKSDLLSFLLFSLVLLYVYISTISIFSENYWIYHSLKEASNIKLLGFIILLLIPVIITYIKNKELQEKVFWFSLLIVSFYYVLISPVFGNLFLIIFILIVISIFLYIETRNKKLIFGILFYTLISIYFLKLGLIEIYSLIASLAYISLIFFVFQKYYNKIKLISRYLILFVLLLSIILTFIDPIFLKLKYKTQEAQKFIESVKGSKIITNDNLIKLYLNGNFIEDNNSIKNSGICIINKKKKSYCKELGMKIYSGEFYDIYVLGLYFTNIKTSCPCKNK